MRVLIADDHGVLRAGLRALLERRSDFEVVGEAANGDETIRLIDALRPDLILLDINMPGRDGITICREIQQKYPNVHALILTVYEDESLLREAVDAGASGYVVKRAVESELITAIQAVQRGDLYIHPSMTRALLGQSTSSDKTDQRDLVEPLTARETEVLCLIALGYTNQQVADELVISVRTVESHRANILAKLGATSRVDLVRYAREHDLI